MLFEADGSGQSEFSYTGEWWESYIDLVFLRARYYDPAIGRFISKDPWMGSPLQPQTQNGWSYVRNNPANRVDPSGRVDWDACTVNGATGVCYAEPGDHLYKIAREIAAEIGMTPDEQLVNALVGEILNLNPQLRARPNLIYPGEEIRLDAEWIMTMRPSQPSPTPAPPSPPPPPPPTHLPTVFKGCPTPSQIPSEPVRLPIAYTYASPFWIASELIVFPPGVSPSIGTVNQGTADALAATGYMLDWAEMLALFTDPTGTIAKNLSIMDVLATGGGTLASGNTYFGQPHTSLPRMAVLGQDLLFTAGDFTIAATAGALLPFLGFASGAGVAGAVAGTGAAVGTDLATTAASILYDRGRLEGIIQPVAAYALFLEGGFLRQAILLYGYQP